MQSTEIFLEHSGLGRPLAWSLGLHVAFTGFVILFGLILSGQRGNPWGAGGGGEAIGVSLVSNIPLPASQVQTQNVLANESKGLTQSKPQEKENEPDAIPIPDKNTKTKPKPASTASHQKAPPQPEEETNEVPYGKGGPVSGPYGTFSAAGAKGGFGFPGRRRRLRNGLRLVRASRAAEGIRELAQVRDRSQAFERRIASTSCSISTDPDSRAMCRSNSRAECLPSTNRPCEPFSELIPSVRCRPTTPVAKSQWNSGSTTRSNEL